MGELSVPKQERFAWQGTSRLNLRALLKASAALSGAIARHCDQLSHPDTWARPQQLIVGSLPSREAGCLAQMHEQASAAA